MSAHAGALLGGMLIGLSATLLLLLNGRIAGVSGIVGRLVRGERILPHAAFVIGLLTGPIVYRAALGAWPLVTVRAGLPLLLVAGVLTGFGARLGSGCTSGHGVLGLARLSRRSIVAVATFLAAGIATVTLMRTAGL